MVADDKPEHRKFGFPTEWKVCDGFAREEWRQVSLNTYEVRNPDYTWLLPIKGWEAYNNGPISFIQWQDRFTLDYTENQEDGRTLVRFIDNGS